MTNEVKSSNKATHRGSCQACGRIQAVWQGFIAKHGYTVDWGHFNGTCAGSERLPLEQSHDLTDSIITQLRETVAPAAEQRAADLRSGAVQPKFFNRVKIAKRNPWEMQKYDDVECTREELSVEDAEQQIRFAAHKADSKAANARSHANMLEKMIAARFGQALIPIAPVVDRKQLLVVGAKVNLGTAKKPMIRKVVALKYMVASGCGPYMNGKHMLHAIFRAEDGRTYGVPARSIRAASIVQ